MGIRHKIYADRQLSRRDLLKGGLTVGLGAVMSIYSGARADSKSGQPSGLAAEYANYDGLDQL